MSDPVNWFVHPSAPMFRFPQNLAPEGALSILKPDGSYLNPIVCDVVDGRYVENPDKVAAEAARILAETQAAEAAEAAKAARRARLRNDVAGANSIPALRALIQDIVVELGI